MRGWIAPRFSLNLLELATAAFVVFFRKLLQTDIPRGSKATTLAVFFTGFILACVFCIASSPAWRSPVVGVCLSFGVSFFHGGDRFAVFLYAVYFSLLSAVKTPETIIIDPAWRSLDSTSSAVAALYPDASDLEKELLPLAFADISWATFASMTKEEIIISLKNRLAILSLCLCRWIISRCAKLSRPPSQQILY